MTETELIVIRRADIYRLFALSFDFPSDENRDSINSIVTSLLDDPSIAINGYGFRNALFDFNELILHADMGLWRAEFNRMFVNEVFVPPSEGSYCLAERGALIGDICGFYKAFHVQVEEKVGPPDQIKVELGFMCIMALKELNAMKSAPDKLQVTREASKSFFEDHLGRWLEKFLKRLSTSSNFPLYRSVTVLLTSWYKLECEYWAVVPIPYPDTLRAEDGEKMKCPFADQCLQ